MALIILIGVIIRLYLRSIDMDYYMTNDPPIDESKQTYG